MPQPLAEFVNPLTVVAVSLALCAVAATLLRRTAKPAVEGVLRAVLARLRPHLPARLRRVTHRYRDRIDAAAARSVLVTGVAAGIAWSAAETLDLAGSMTATISATLSVQMSSHASLREGTQRLVGTLAGIALAVAVWGAFGLTPWSIAVIAGCGLAVGRLLRLGDSSVTVPLTSLGILVAGSAVTEAFVWERVAATVLGIAIGAILSPLVGGMTPLERARGELAHLSTGIARLIGDLGAGVCGGYTPDQARGWLARSRELGEDLDDAAAAVDDLARQARWSLTTPVTRVAPLHQTSLALEHGVHQVNSVARSMFDAAATPYAARVPEQIGQVLTAAAEAFAAHAALVADPDADAAQQAGHLHDLLDGLRDARSRTLRKVRTEVDDTGVLVLTGSIITDIDRMTGTLERSAPALTVGVREPGPGIPAISEMLPAARLIWAKKVTARSGR
ncbi:FUSC family protein [Actinoplanes aureus]|uniref:FUSC family protein n=1 Tax=Actinoplanes aureus TaxID=2792083 RepID=A0A931CBP7_9ACTN|nr:aromatic acid exporter family protein [Actinoplanes aureus]MBG0564411.1 FUSC family protein [Actinoplanes aureus]